MVELRGRAAPTQLAGPMNLAAPEEVSSSTRLVALGAAGTFRAAFLAGRFAGPRARRSANSSAPGALVGYGSYVIALTHAGIGLASVTARADGRP